MKSQSEQKKVEVFEDDLVRVIEVLRQGWQGMRTEKDSLQWDVADNAITEAFQILQSVVGRDFDISEGMDDDHL